MGGHPVGEGKVLPQPLKLLFPKGFNGLPALRSTDDSSNHQKQNIHELVFLVLVLARVFQIGKMFHKGGSHWQLLFVKRQ
jgi:hypothetical protein